MKCKLCGNPFARTAHRRLFCSRKCSCTFTARNKPSRIPTRDESIRLFWSLVDRGTESECWLWRGSKAGNYGTLQYCGTKVYAHRLAYEIHTGVPPNGLMVCHDCDVPLCVNPHHLFLGTAQDNVDDMWAKGRARPPQAGFRKGIPHPAPEKLRGENNGNAKLTQSQVNEIRARYVRVSYKVSNTRELAREFGVCTNMILHIVKGKAWK